MSAIEQLYKHRDRFGMIQPSPGEPAPTSGNGALFSVEYFLFLSENEKAIEIERLKIVLRNLEQKTDNGLTTIRYPGCRFTDSMDNATALIIFSELYDDSRLSKELYKHGELTYARRIDDEHDYERSFKYYPIAWLLNKFSAPRRFYNVRPYDWSIQSWWGRSPGFMALLELSAIDRTSWPRLAALWIGQFVPVLFRPKEDSDGKKLNYVVWQWLKKRNKFWNWSYKLWCFLLMRMHPNGMKDVYAQYYGEKHPFTENVPRYLP